MLKVHVNNDRTNWLWRVEIVSSGGVIFSRVAHSLEELSQILKDAADIVALEAAKEDAQS